MLDDLDSGAADVALGGLWVPAMYAGTPRKLSVFAQVNHQFPKALVTRTPQPDFTWSDLVGATVLAPGIGGSAPYAFTAGLIRESGVDPRSITFLRDLSTPMFVELFEAGLGDAIVLDHTNAEALQHKGTGFIANDYTVTGGLGPNSVYYCRTDRMEELSDRLVRFTSGTRRVDAADEVGDRRRAPAAARRALADHAAGGIGRRLHADAELPHLGHRPHRPLRDRAMDANPVRGEHGSQRARLQRRGRHAQSSTRPSRPLCRSESPWS